MTSEVAVLTKQCVVLAADSAVTVGDKIFNTVNKVFALSKYQPVGIMAYSSADVMGVPVETAIKEFRRRLGSKEHEHLEDYARAFEEFLISDHSVFSDDARLGSLVNLARERMTELVDRTNRELQKRNKWGHPTLREGRDALLQALTECEERVSASQPLTIAHPRKTRKLIADVINPAMDNELDQLKRFLPVSSATERRIRRLALEHFFHDVNSGRETGFAIAGFGSKDVFPRLRSFEFCCSALGVCKLRPGQEVDISDGFTAAIRPFAQSDVMATFVEGRDPLYRGAMVTFLDGFFEVKTTQLQGSAPQVAALMKSVGEELKQGLVKHLDEIGQEEFIQPLMGVVDSMPKEELAQVAEALVNLTALKRRASRDVETVGGPTDVAIITKGDGLIWIKRKHYFDVALNPAFAARYLEDRDEA